MDGKYKNYINYGGLFLIVWLAGFGTLNAIFGIATDGYVGNILLKIVCPFYAIISVVAYIIGRENYKRNEAKKWEAYYYDKGLAHGIYKTIKNISKEEYQQKIITLKKDNEINKKVFETLEACERNNIRSKA